MKAILKSPCKYYQNYPDLPIFYAQMYQPLFFRDTFYYQFGDEIYYLEDDHLEFYCSIPECDMQSQN